MYRRMTIFICQSYVCINYIIAFRLIGTVLARCKHVSVKACGLVSCGLVCFLMLHEQGACIWIKRGIEKSSEKDQQTCHFLVRQVLEQMPHY